MASPILDSVYTMVDQIIAFIPTLLAVILLLIVGLIVGKTLGKIGAKVLDRIGLDDLLDKTIIGNMIKKTGGSIVGFFDVVIRWFIYLIFAIIIIDLLKIQVVADFIASIILYIPVILSAFVTLLIGLLVVDFLADLIRNILMATGIDGKLENTPLGTTIKASGMKISGIMSGIFRVFGYLVFIVAALNILNLTMIAQLIESMINYLPNLFAGVLILIIGLLAIDFFADYIGNVMKGMKVENADIWVPAFRGILSLVVMLLALDAMLIDTGIFYLLIGPLAWGIAVVVAFKWGIKEAIVAYARERK
ncbi:hypothetical protein [uncultured Methanomethylovorans sp.]|uniref:mechanosensitive ion channel family protein n=1 Tax=uncultured Methanomethylovorans sp. TaxID=183759 RepID=UPI00374890BE